MKQTDEDQEIAEGLVRGNRDAWLRLYDRHAAALWRSVSAQLGGDGHGVADVVQATFLAAASSARSYDRSRGTIWMWLWGIGRQQALKHFRERRRGQPVSFDAPAVEAVGEWLSNGQPAPPELLESKELSEIVRTVLAALADDDAYILAAAYIDTMSMAEIASRLGKSIEATRSQAARARRAFREKFSVMTRESTSRRTHHVS